MYYFKQTYWAGLLTLFCNYLRKDLTVPSMYPNLIASSFIYLFQLSLCIQRKRTLLTFKSLNPSDPILASLDIPLKEAEKRIRKVSRK